MIFYRLVTALCILTCCFFASVTAYAADASGELISDPKTMIVAGAYVLIEFVLGKTTLLKSNSVVELVLRNLGRIILVTFGLKKYGYELKDN